MQPFFTFLILLNLLAINLQAFNLRKQNSGVHGSIVNSIFQDNRGVIWVGTNTGLSRFDSKQALPIDGFGSIKNMIGSGDEIIAETLYGLKMYQWKNDSLSNFEMFGNTSFVAYDNQTSVFVVQGNGSVYYKTRNQSSFDNIIIPDLIANELVLFKIEEQVLYTLSSFGKLRSFEIIYKKGHLIGLEERESILLGIDIMHCFQSEKETFLMDSAYNLYRLEPMSGQTFLLKNLKLALSEKGKLTTAIVFHNEFYFGFETGLFYIQEDKALKLPLKSGVNCLFKDKYQDLIWIGTAGEGLFTLSYKQHSIVSHRTQDFCSSVSKPITAICLTANNTLWLGTLGNGVITIPNFKPDRELENIQRMSLGNHPDDNIVHSLHRTNYGIWIGSQSGLFFYSTKNKNIKKVSDQVKNIYAIHEQDSLLWLACYEKGIVKINFLYKNESPELSHIQLYSLDKGDEVSNRFCSIKENKTNLFFLNQQSGIYEILDNVLLPVLNKLGPVNQIETIDISSFILSSDFGAYLYTSNSQKHLFTIPTKDIVHGFWSDYWLSTDQGLIVYNTDLKTSRYFDDRYGLDVNEYLNGSAYLDSTTYTIYFGGVNGFTTVRYNNYDEAMDYMPPLFLESINILGIDTNSREFEAKNIIVLNSKENFFSITFHAPDYINGYNYNYYYKIGKNGQWLDNGNSGKISFNDISSGNYELYVKYYNKMLNKESYTKIFNIKVLPPFYKSIYAFVIYTILFVLLVYLVYWVVAKRRQRRLKEEAIEAVLCRKEEILEAKLDFFTAMAHELCTPLTLISGPCKQIIQQKNTTPTISKYAETIHRNAKRMNSLISDLMSFKQMESGYKQAIIKEVNITEVTNGILDTFRINTSGNKIGIKRQYPKNLIWNTDESFFSTILVNLISNAVKYSEEEPIIVEINIKDEILLLTVSNEGKGLSEDEISSIFNKYKVLDKGKSGEWRQNGLGLAITAGMVELLGGNINIESITNSTTSFLVSLPFVEKQIEENLAHQALNKEIVPAFVFPTIAYEFHEDRKTVAVIDDDPEMLWFIRDILATEFNVLAIHNPKTTKEVLLQNHVDVLLCDVMMEELDGIKLTEMIKTDKACLHIPLIIVSAVHDVEMQTKAINAGAELYITKPFDVAYLISAIHRLVGRKEDLKNYFSSPLSVYEQSMGKLQHSEHRKFLKKLYLVINRNITSENLTPDFIASELGMSTRSLYRKIKEATDKGLNEIINEGKLSVAENLFIKSKFTIDEILFKSGFTNRASFYHIFTKKYGCTPSEYQNKHMK